MAYPFMILVLLLAATACAEDTPDPPSAGMSDTDTAFIDLLVADMTQEHEGRPSGVPLSSQWAEGPRIGYGNQPPAGWTAMIPWGQVYMDTSGNPAVNSRAQIRRMEAWFFSKRDASWKVWSSSSELEGANYAEDFVDDVNIPADLRKEPTARGGGYSATLPEGYNFHFWPAEGRVRIDPDDIGGVWVRMQGRLVLDDPAGPDDRDTARLMLSVGADYWKSMLAEWDQWTTNGDIGIGRFKYLTRAWQDFNMHTLSEAELHDHPPPGS